jgi:molybdenum-dependent DNA-binding transcriptional regulator ModE
MIPYGRRRLTLRIDVTSQGATIGAGKIKLLDLVDESRTWSRASRRPGRE